MTSTCQLLVHFRHIKRYMSLFCFHFALLKYVLHKLTVIFYIQRWFAFDQVRGCYQSITEAFDFYPDDDVIWDPYSPVSIAARYPGGLSALCTRDQEY
jgi:hypothetical protein